MPLHYVINTVSSLYLYEFELNSLITLHYIVIYYK